MKKFIKPFIISLSVILVILILVGVFLAYNSHLIVYFTIRHIYSPDKTPEQYLTISKTISIDPVSMNDGYKKFKWGSIKIFVPFPDEVEEKTYDDTIISVKDQHDRNVAIWKPFNIKLHESYPLLPFPGNPHVSEEHEEKWERMFGYLYYKSPFEIEKAVLNTTPDSVTITSSPEDMVRTNMLLMSKLVLPDRHAIYELAIGNINGIQKGDPNLGDGPVYVRLYFPDDMMTEIQFVGWNQDEILDILSRIVYDPDAVELS